MSHMYICFFKTDDLNQVYIIVLKLNEGTGHRASTRDRLIFPFYGLIRWSRLPKKSECT